MSKPAQLCLFCRSTGLILVEREGDLGTYVDCSYCDALADQDDYYPPTERPSSGRDFRGDE